jgi:membrane-bound lytic murein transglycosylase D
MRAAKNTLAAFAILLTSGCAALDSTPQGPQDNPCCGNATSLETDRTTGSPSRDQSDALQEGDTQDPAESDFWQQLRAGFHLSEGHQQAVADKIDFYSRKAGQVEQILQRGEPWLAYIYERVRKRDFPNEIVLLPFVESAYDPYAYSPGRAAGLWQFIPRTATHFGLKQDWWYDGRRDVVASTDAALNYLDRLQQEFDGNWLLALAAYNAGAGTVRRAIKRNRQNGKPADFWHLDLPPETSAYVPKLLAISAIIKQPERYGVHLSPVATSPGFVIVNTHAQLDLAVAADLAGIDLRELQLLNPGFNHFATRPQGPHRLVVPADKSAVFEQNLAALPPSRRVKWVRYKVRHGDTLIGIAKHYDTTAQVLRSTNGLRGSFIRAGQHLLVAVAAKDAARYASLARRNQAPISGRKLIYRVRRGDSLWTIARAHDVSVRQLVRWNHLAYGTTIRPGQQLTIGSRHRVTTRAGGTVRSIRYTVRRGDSLFLISRKYNVSIANLRQWNGLEKQKYLRPGQKLKLYIDVARLSQNGEG